MAIDISPSAEYIVCACFDVSIHTIPIIALLKEEGKRKQLERQQQKLQRIQKLQKQGNSRSSFNNYSQSTMDEMYDLDSDSDWYLSDHYGNYENNNNNINNINNNNNNNNTNDIEYNSSEYPMEGDEDNDFLGLSSLSANNAENLLATIIPFAGNTASIGNSSINSGGSTQVAASPPSLRSLAISSTSVATKTPRLGSVTSVVWWRTLQNEDICIVATKRGSVYFVNLLTQTEHCVLRLKKPIEKIELIDDMASSQSKFLLLHVLNAPVVNNNAASISPQMITGMC